MSPDISRAWEELERDAEAERADAEPSRLFRALGRSAVGIRASYIPKDRIIELLIEVPSAWDGRESLPSWRGMQFEMLQLPLPPRRDVDHLRLYLVDQEHKNVFVTFCQDLVDSLEGITKPSTRVREIEECISRWGRFFEKCGTEGLSRTQQRGLFAELDWLAKMLNGGVDVLDAVKSWKGCERNYHDFDLGGHILEVKSTISKEPRSVRINNERQLDDRGLTSLHLFVLTLHDVEGGGISLPDQVHALRNSLAGSASARARFERGLVSAGYLDAHANRYGVEYNIRNAELFKVYEGFPRIVDLPPGTGRLRYSVSISSCKLFEIDTEDHLDTLAGRRDA